MMPARSNRRGGVLSVPDRPRVRRAHPQPYQAENSLEKMLAHQLAAAHHVSVGQRGLLPRRCVQHRSIYPPLLFPPRAPPKTCAHSGRRFHSPSKLCLNGSLRSRSPARGVVDAPGLKGLSGENANGVVDAPGLKGLSGENSIPPLFPFQPCVDERQPAASQLSCEGVSSPCTSLQSGRVHYEPPLQLIPPTAPPDAPSPPATWQRRD
jgi:hypothetical protein